MSDFREHWSLFNLSLVFPNNFGGLSFPLCIVSYHLVIHSLPSNTSWLFIPLLFHLSLWVCTLKIYFMFVLVGLLREGFSLPCLIGSPSLHSEETQNHRGWELCKDTEVVKGLHLDLVLNPVLFLLCHTCLTHPFVISPVIIYCQTILCNRIYWRFQGSNGGRATSYSITQHWVLDVLILSYSHHWDFITDYFFFFGSHDTPTLVFFLLSSLSTFWVTSFSFSQAAHENSKFLSQFSMEWLRYFFPILFIPWKWQEDGGGKGLILTQRISLY